MELMVCVGFSGSHGCVCWRGVVWLVGWYTKRVKRWDGYGYGYGYVYVYSSDEGKSGDLSVMVQDDAVRPMNLKDDSSKKDERKVGGGDVSVRPTNGVRLTWCFLL